jgi:galactan endo-1,6-beta-galactosidase
MNDMITIDKNENRGTWEGWGCSLAWWAHAVGGKNYQDLYADLFFTGKTVPFLDRQLPGLNMNIIRYNVGGGGLRGADVSEAEQISDILPWHRDIPGFWIDPQDKEPNSASWDWTRDANQRSLTQAAIERGVNLVEFFSNAPMWWMMDSQSSAGGNLLVERRRDFAIYLATVTQYAQDNWGIKVDYVEPFNEPTSAWWDFPKNQEGCHIGREEQVEILGYLREELDRRGLQKVALTAADENTMKMARETYEYYQTHTIQVNGQQRTAADLVEKINVHSYEGGVSPWRDNNERRALREYAGSTRLWPNEFGNSDESGMELAQTIMEDINFARPTAWLYWQALEPASAWGLVNGKYAETADDPTTGEPTHVHTNYYVMAQFTRFLRPGYQIIGNSNDNSIVAYNTEERKLIAITVNYGNAQTIEYDLSNLQQVGTSGTITVTNTNGSKLFQSSPIQVNNKRFSLQAEAKSVYSMEINDVTLSVMM